MTPPASLLVLIGPPGAGKSLVGKLVAKLLRVPFVDTDRRIVVRHGAISTIFAERGEDWFRDAERSEVQAALRERAVVSLGGGAILDRNTQADLAGARVAFLTVAPDAVERRIRGTARPLLVDGMDAWTKIADGRRAIYEGLASRTIDTSHRSAASVAHELAEWVQREETA